MRLRFPLLLAAALLAGQATAQTPTGQTNLTLFVNAYHDTQSFGQTSDPSNPLSASVQAVDNDLVPGRDFGAMQFAKASGSVDATSIALYAAASGSAFTQTGFYGAGALATATAYLNLPFLMQNAALTGTQGTLVVPLLVSGDIALGNGFHDPVSNADAAGRAYVALWATGMPAGGSPDCGATFGADRCLDLVHDSQGNRSLGNGVAGSSPLLVPFRFGDWSSVNIQMWTSARVQVSASGGGVVVEQTGMVDFAHTVRWGGVAQVLDAAGNPVADWTIQSLPGVDLSVASVPEPRSGALLAAGGLLLAWRARQRRQRRPD